jgi:hypothetical protein
VYLSILTLTKSNNGWNTLYQPVQIQNGTTFNFSVSTLKYPLLVELRDQTGEQCQEYFEIDPEASVEQQPPITNGNSTNETSNGNSTTNSTNN